MTDREERRATSFLVRLWLEPGGDAGSPAATRGFIRNLQTGQENYVADPESLVRLLSQQLRAQQGSGSGREDQALAAGS